MSTIERAGIFSTCDSLDVMKRLLPIGLLAALLLPGAAFASDASDVRLVDFPHGVVHAGDVVELTWSQPPRDIGELEILLSVDGGRHFALRVSPELDARDGHWRWRVPDLNAGSACLRLRVGDEREERLGESTECFRIVGSNAAPNRASNAANAVAPAGLRAPDAHPVHEAAWWSAAEGAPAAGAAIGAGRDQASFQREAAVATFAPQRRDLGAIESQRATRALRLESMTSVPFAEHTRTAVTRNLPLRE